MIQCLFVICHRSIYSRAFFFLTLQCLHSFCVLLQMLSLSSSPHFPQPLFHIFLHAWFHLSNHFCRMHWISPPTELCCFCLCCHKTLMSKEFHVNIICICQTIIEFVVETDYLNQLFLGKMAPQGFYYFCQDLIHVSISHPLLLRWCFI